MNLFKSEFIDSADPIVPRRKPKVVYATKKQTGKRVDLTADKKRTALPPGKRISKSGKIYYEGRANRTDIKGFKY